MTSTSYKFDFWRGDDESEIVQLLCDELRSLAEEELDTLKTSKVISSWRLGEVNDGMLFYDVSLGEEKDEFSVCSLSKNILSFSNYTHLRFYSDHIHSRPNFEMKIDESSEWKTFYKYCDGYSWVSSSGPSKAGLVKDLVAEVLETLLGRGMKKLVAARSAAHKMFGLE